MRSRRGSWVFVVAVVGLLLSEAVVVPSADAQQNGDCTIIGTEGDDVLVGSNRDDVICGLGGNDIIEAGHGADVVVAGPGDDEVYGGNGDDVIYGGSGADLLDGGNGADALYGDDGADTVVGGRGDDSLTGGAGDDLMSGEAGDDYLIGAGGSDELAGGPGHDICAGELFTDCEETSPDVGGVAPESVTLVAPVAGSTVFQDVTVNGVVSPAEAEGTVRLLVDGVVVSESPIASGLVSFSWDSASLVDGSRELVLEAVDEGGALAASDSSSVIVANGASAAERIQVDFDELRISAVEYAEYGVWSLMNVALLPDRYRTAPVVELETATPAALQFLSVWDQLTLSEQEALEDFVTMEEIVVQPTASSAQTWTLALGSPVVPANLMLAQTTPSLPADCDDGDTIRLWEAFAKLFRCRTDVVGQNGDVLFEIYYTPEGFEDEGLRNLAGGFVSLLTNWSDPIDPTDLDGNGIPDVVDEAATSLSQSYVVYDGVSSPSGLMSRAPSGPIAVAMHDTPGAVLPKLINRNPLVQISNERRFSYLPRHELFHRFQYEYLTSTDFVINREEANWWMEATAEWAAHQVAVAVGPFADPDPATPTNEAQEEADLYASNLRNYLDEPEGPIDAYDGLSGSEQYGAFILAEYFEERFGAGFIDQTWIETGASDGRSLIGIQSALGSFGQSWATVLSDYRRATYLLSSADGVEPFQDVATPVWRADLRRLRATQGDEDIDQDGDGLPDELGLEDARPSRVEGNPIELAAGSSVIGSSSLHRGGAAYIDLVPTTSDDGVLEVSLSYNQDITIPDVQAQVLLFDTYPTMCAAPVDIGITELNGVFQGDASVAIDSACRFATLVVVNRSVTEAAPVVAWTASFQAEGPIYGSNILSDPSVEFHLAATGGGPLGIEIPTLVRQADGTVELEWFDGTAAPDTSLFAYTDPATIATVLTESPLLGQYHIQMPPEQVFEVYLTERRANVPATSALGTLAGRSYTAQVRPGDSYKFTAHAKEATVSSGSDREFGVGVIFYDVDGNSLYQNFRTFETSAQYQAFSVQGTAFLGTEHYALAFVENDMSSNDGGPIDVDALSFGLGDCLDDVLYGPNVLRDPSFEDLVFLNGDQDGGIPKFSDTSFTTVVTEDGVPGDIEDTSWANEFSLNLPLWDVSFANPTDGFYHAEAIGSLHPADLYVADVVGCSDGRSYSARVNGGDTVELAVDVASSPVANSSAVAAIHIQAFRVDGSFAGEAGPVVDRAVSTSYERVAEQWQVPPDAYWIRAWVEVDGSNGGDPIIWRIDNAALSVSP